MADQKYEPDMIEGTVEEIVFANDVNGYTVCVIDSGGEPVNVVGVIPYLSAIFWYLSARSSFRCKSCLLIISLQRPTA